MDNITTQIKAELDAAAHDEQSALQHYIEAGKLLAVKKEELDHGEWMAYCRDLGIHRDKAQRYMLVGANYARVRNLGSLREALAAIRENKELKVSKSGHVNWLDVAREEEVISANPGGNLKPLRDRIAKLDPELEIVPRKGVKEEDVPRLRKACRVIHEEDVASGVIDKREERARRDRKAARELAEREAELVNSRTAKQKLDSAIRAAKRSLQLDYEAAVMDEVERRLGPILERYNIDMDKKIARVNRYKGPFTQKEYNLVRMALHGDRYPGIDDVQRSRLDKAFHVLTEKKFELCGLADDEKLTNTLPKTVAELMRMRKNKS